MRQTKETNQVIAKQIGVNPVEFQETIEIIVQITQVDPESLEIVKIWQLRETELAEDFEFWQILVFNSIGDENHQCYLLFDVIKWGKERHPQFVADEENVNWLEGSDEILDVNCGDNLISELIFASETHEVEDIGDYLEDW